MIDLRYEKKLRTELANWADANVIDARQFVQRHKYLLRDLTNAQLYGLLNMIHNVSDFEEIGAYANHQAKKASAAGKKIQDFWLNWDKRQKMIFDDGLTIARQTNSSWVNDKGKLKKITSTLLVRYIQHVIAEISILRATAR